MLLSTLLQGLPDIQLVRDCEVTGIAYDSREVREGNLFVAIKGYKLDGHDFVADAISRGASGVVVEDMVCVPQGKGMAIVENTRFVLSHLACAFYGNPSRDLLVVGITGTKGKTTTCHMVKDMLDSMGYSTGLLGTVHDIIGDEVRPVKHTTPESLDLLSMQKEMVEKGCTAVVMEVSSHALALDRVAHVEFDVAVFTNIGMDHLDFHRTLDNYVNTKGRLFESLARRPSLPGQNLPFAAINCDDSFSDYFLSVAPKKSITYGLEQESDVRALNVQAGSRGSSFAISYCGKTIKTQINLPGRFNVYNALAASTVALGLGLDLERVSQILPRLGGVRGRAEVVSGTEEYTVWVDYAHTPESLKDILSTARQVADNRVIVVFGCGGDRDTHKRPVMGRISGEIADMVIITDDNPRTEDEEEILDQIEVGIDEARLKKPGLVFERIKDRERAIARAISSAQKGDVVVIAGKGHETYQVFRDRVVSFDDAEVARKVIGALKDHSSLTQS